MLVRFNGLRCIGEDVAQRQRRDERVILAGIEFGDRCIGCRFPDQMVAVQPLLAQPEQERCDGAGAQEQRLGLGRSADQE
jgi:hypothetical protein